MPSVSAPAPVLAPSAWLHWFQRQRPRPRQSTQCFHLGAAGTPALSFRALGALRVTCTAGTVWLTCEGDIRDHVLEAGDEHLAGPGDELVLLGMPSANVLFTTGGTPGRPGRD